MRRIPIRAGVRMTLLAAACWVQSAAALVPDVVWETVLGISHFDPSNPAGGYAVAANGDAVVAGMDSATQCMGLIKVRAADGAQAWRTNVCAAAARPNHVVLDPQGNVVVAGTITVPPGLFYGRIAKYSGATGALIWERIEDDTTQAGSVAIDPNGNLVVALGVNYETASVRKYSSDGTRLWSVPMGVSAGPIHFDAQGDIVVGGQVGDSINNTWTVTKLASASGATRWSRTTDRINDGLMDLKVDATGDVIATGYSFWGYPSFAMQTIKYAGGDGTVRWHVMELPAHPNDMGRGLAIAPQGDVIVTARLNNDVYTVRYRGADGTKSWSTTYDGAMGAEDRGNRVFVDAAGDVVVVATVNVQGAFFLGQTADIRTFKYTGATGKELWSYGVSRPGAQSKDFGLMAVPTSNGIIAIGNYDLATGIYVARYGTEARDPLNAAGLWWNAPALSESGWGLNMTHQGEIIFLTWFSYNDDGSPAWLVMPRAMNVERGTYVGRVYRTAGPAFSSVPFNPSQVAATDVGFGTIGITGPMTASFTYHPADGSAAIVKSLTRQVFGPLPVCGMLNAPGLPNYQDLWWANPAGSESGWGMNIAQQGDTMFLTWFTYGAGGKAIWYVGPDVRRASGNTFTGKLYRTTGPSYRSAAWDASRVAAFEAGSATLDFTGQDRATFSYIVDGISQTKPIMRQGYAAPATVCR